MRKYTKYLMGLAVLGFMSCNSFLDTMPDNRAEVDTPEKVKKLLVSAYPDSPYILMCEVSSDNVDRTGANNPNGSVLTDQIYAWEEIRESGNESPITVWAANHTAIAAANQALLSIEEMGNTKNLQGSKAEALLCRAYAHFMLVNIFGQHYSEAHSATDLGVAYMTAPETTLDPKYKRESVKSNYEKIEADILAALPHVRENVFDVPKYHFNENAAYAFAARFYLYKGDMDKVIEYASKVLGPSPATMLRDNKYLATLPQDGTATAKEFISPSLKANLLLLTGTSSLGYTYGPYSVESRYTHNKVISDTETYDIKKAPWGNINNSSVYHIRSREYSGTNLNKVIMPRLPFYFEYIDPVAGIGYRKTVYAAFTSDETLLARAEAYVRTNQFDLAVADINSWLGAYVKNFVAVTQADIEAWANGYAYYTPQNPTPKKELNPDFDLVKGSAQENLLQYVLYLRRFETLHTGLRWFDIKRYGITVTRRLIDGGAVQAVLPNVLMKRDNRSALQLPADVISAGLTPNPR